MSKMRWVAVAAALATLSCACTPTGGAAPAATAQAAPAAANVAAPDAAPALQPPETAPAGSAPGIQRISAAQLAQKRFVTRASCNIETLDGKPAPDAPFQVAARQVNVGGWFLPEATKTTGGAASLRLQDEAGTNAWDAPIQHWQSRQDVIGVMHGVDTGNAGFAETLDLRAVPPGRYRLFVVFSQGPGDFFCDNGRVLVVP